MRIETIDTSELLAGLAAQGILLVDVREPHEFDAGHIPGSVSLPLSRFDPGSLPRDERRVVFSCAAGVRSRQAIEAAHAAGYPFSTHYPGGFKGWVMSGGRVETG